MRQAVILAAGLGSRMRSVTGDVYPKPLTPVGGKSLIERSLYNLKQSGVEEIVVITGHCHAEMKVLEAIEGVRLIYNPHYATSGSSYSFLCAVGQLDSPFYLLESDLFYDFAALHLPENLQNSNYIVTSSPLNLDDNVYFKSSDGILINVNKAEPGGEPEGVMTGIWALSSGFIERFKAWCEKVKPDYGGHYETLLAEYSATTEPIHILHKSDLIWCEIDHEDHLQHAEKVILPKLRV